MRMYEEIMFKNFPNVAKDPNLQIKKNLMNLNRMTQENLHKDISQSTFTKLNI
jgi:hypothetical protein